MARIESQVFDVIADTEATGADGKRKTDYSDWEYVKAPEGFVINKDAIIREVVSERGSEYKDEQVFSELVEIIPGTNIQLPRKFEARAMARSEKGAGGGGGHSHYRYTVPFVEIQGS